MKTIRLSDNVPQDLVLTSVIGRPVLTPRGHQLRFLTNDGRALELPMDAGITLQHRMVELGVVGGDRILVARTTSYPAGELTRTYQVFKCDAAPAIGQQSDGSFVVPAAPGSNGVTAVLGPTRKTLDPVGSTISLEGLRKAFALAHTLSQAPEVPAAQRDQFRAIQHLIWKACGR